METHGRKRSTQEELQALEQQLEREWWWLHGALNALAEVQAGRPVADVAKFRHLQAQVREIDRRRLELSVQISQRAGAIIGP